MQGRDALVVRVLDDGCAEVHVPADHPRSRLCVETDGRLLRIALEDATLAWARVAGFGQGFSWTRLPHTGTLAVIAPISSSDARRIEPSAWPRAFAERLVASRRTWLAAGDCAIAPLPRTRSARGLRDALDAPLTFFEPWGPHNGSGRVLSLRAGSAPESARVKAWRKHARAGTLPPVLLGWLSALDAYVLLDGHDRLLAAQLERVLPDARAVYSYRDATWSVAEEERAARLARYERVFRNEARLSNETRSSANRDLVAAFDDDRLRLAHTHARFRRDLIALARRELDASSALLA